MTSSKRKPVEGVAKRRRDAVAPGATCASILGEHPAPPHVFGAALAASDGRTRNDVPHRALTETIGARANVVTAAREMIVRHHVASEALQRTLDQRAAMKRLGLEKAQAALPRFPVNPSTRKGNLAEIVLAEYVVASAGADLPIYRLRYNPNVDQSMKGDDVLAFDLDAEPPRLIVGEAKFRGTSSTAAVKEILDGLIRSHKSGLPVSLQFVAERLFESGNEDLGARVLDCARLFALGQLGIDYVGLLLSDTAAATRVEAAPSADLRRLAMISLAVDGPDGLCDACYENLV